MNKQHQYVSFYKNVGSSVTCIFMGKPDLEFDMLLGRTQFKTEERIFHVAFDPVTCDREFVWKWFERFTNGTTETDNARASADLDGHTLSDGEAQ
jgi:hypothetical protein